VRDVAKEIGVSPATLSRIERGHQPDLGTFPKLCRWLQLDPAEVLDLSTAGRSSAPAESSDVITATVHLRAQRNIRPEVAQALGEMILAVQRMSPDEPPLSDED
jgi:transcriptional regulator with XRE-family HTH domain